MPKLEIVGNSAFNNCSSLASIGDMPNVTSIGRWAFSDCTSLESIGDLRSVTEIGDYAFSNCSSLILRVRHNSYAEQYAKDNYIKYTYIED